MTFWKLLMALTGRIIRPSKYCIFLRVQTLRNATFLIILTCISVPVSGAARSET